MVELRGPGHAGRKTPAARYDGHADWYDGWAQTAAAPFMVSARAALAELLPPGPGLALDVGCGGGLNADVAAARGLQVFGLDYSGDQLRHAVRRMPVVRADARALPVPDQRVQVVMSVLTHTDVDGFPALVREAVRVLAPGGVFVYVGVHPCFNNPYAERLEGGVLVHAGYRRAGWAPPVPLRGDGVLRRIGVHHLPLADLLTALVHELAPIDRVLERGEGGVPDVLAVRLLRA